MDDKSYLIQEIRSCKKRKNLAQFLNFVTVGAAAGGCAAVILEGLSIFVPFYAVHRVSLAAICVGMICGTGFAIRKRCSMKQAAHQMDGFGFQERILTAYERLGQDGMFDQMQRADAAGMLRKNQEKIQIPVRPESRKIVALVLALGLSAALAFVPSQAKDTAAARHAITQEAKEKQKEAKKVEEALKNADTSSMTKEQKEQLQKLIESLELSQKELQQADTAQELAAAEQKLSYKYEQAAESVSADVLAAAGFTGENASAGAATGENTPTGGQPSADTGQTGSQAASTQQSSENTGGSGESQNGNSQNGNGNGNNGNGQNGNGNGSGNGNGNGNGTGSGNGNGSGSGSGSGRGTGSSDQSHDYVSVPNKVGNDSAANGSKGDSKDSDYYKAKNGLAWEGDHVDLDSVVGDYTKNAYEGIANGKYPAGMEDVIRSYFENLN